MSDNKLKFTVRSGLKNIIGKDLITDDYVAVFELVKNSFDAYAKKVTITFEEDKITIADDGKGMDITDIKKKWLSVAYSAKKEGVEDADLDEKEFENYRDKIQAKKFFAGAKGIGRFSCDRLGSKLRLTTKKATNISDIEQIDVDWNDFEQDPEQEFIDISVRHITLQPSTKKLKAFKYGTVLEILDLNSKWDRKKKQGLKHSLEKLINPFEDNQLDGFSIWIEDEIEEEEDQSESLLRDKVNGEVKNFVFETLGLKTTQILTQIDPKGDFITTSLWDRETLIYKIRRKNNTNPKLENIKIHLFHLNRAAKSNFTRIMGIQPVNFGSIFVYKNGFRIPPYGDYGFDYFGLDSRKTQKHFDRFGSRDLIGRIEVIGANINFKEISSRDGGLVRNDHYHALVRFLITNTLQKIENYANEVQFTNLEDKNRDDLSALKNIAAKSALLNLISSEVGDDEIELIDIDTENLSIRTNELLQSASENDIKALKAIAFKFGDVNFKEAIQTTEEEHIQIIELQKKLIAEEEERQQRELELETERQKNTYLLATRRTLSPDADGLIHTIKINNIEIKHGIDNVINDISSDSFVLSDILTRLGNIKVNAERSIKLAELATRSDFKKDIDHRDVDIVKYFLQYIEVYKTTFGNTELEIEFNINNSKLIRRISILDLSIVIDNIVSNSVKWDADKIKLVFNNPTSKSLCIIISDSGKGLSERFLKIPNSIFELGVGDTPPTGAGGSGIGLYFTKKLLSEMNADIKFTGNGKELSGASFEINFN